MRNGRLRNSVVTLVAATAVVISATAESADAGSLGRRSKAAYTFTSARAAYSLLQDATARDGFEWLIARVPNSSFARQARLYLADLALRSGDLSGARAQVESLLASTSLDPHRTRAEIARAWLALLAGDGAIAQAAFEAVRDRTPGSRAASQALLGLGWQGVLDGRYNDAVSYFSAIKELEVSSEDLRAHARLAIAHSFYRAGRYADAEAELQVLLSEFPGHTIADDARRDLGWCALARGDAVTALETFEALATRPADTGSSYSGAENLIRRSKDELLAAVLGFHTLQARRPGGPDPMVELIQLFDHAAATEAAEGIEAARAALGW